jgi:outer membrane protein assembly factor BamA/autotransporter translocation and assembly factor TamB
MADTPSSSSAPRRKWYRVRRWVVICGIVLVVLVGGLLAMVHTRPAREYALHQVRTLLAQQNIEFDSEQLSYNLLDLRLALQNVRVRSHEQPDLPAFASIGRVNLDLSLRALLRGRYVLQSGVAEGVAVHYLVTADGRDNLPRPPRDPNQPGEPLDYLIDDLQIRNATIRYENHPQRIDATLPVSLVRVQGNALTDRHAVSLDSSNGRLVVQERAASISRLAGRVDLGEDDVRVERLDVDAEGARLAVTGSISQFADPQGDVALKGTIDAERAAAIAGLAERITGTVGIDASAKGRLSAPAIAGQVTGTGVTFRNLSDVDLSSAISYDVPSKRAAFSDLKMKAPFGQVSGRGSVSLEGRDTSNISAALSSIDAARLMRAFEMPYIVASRVDAQLEAEWPGLDYARASGRATAHLTPTASRPSRSVIPVGGRIDATGRGNAVDVVLARITAAGAEVDGRVRVLERQQLAGTAQLRVADAANAVRAAEAIVGRADLVPTSVAGVVTATARIGGTVQAPEVAADLHAPALAVGTASALTLNAGVTYTPAAVTVRQLDVAWQQARARASGTIGLSGARTLDLSLDANALEVAEVTRALGQQVPASGTLSFNGRVGGTASQPSASISVAGANLVAYNETWGTLAARVSLAGRQVGIADLVVDKPQPQGNGRIVANATYHLDRRAYTADLRSKNVRLLALALPDGRQVRGALQLTGRGAGTVDQPAGTLGIVADALRIDRYDVGRVVADAVVAGRQATITAAVPAYGVNADARIGTQRPFATTARVRVEDLDLAKLPVRLETPLDGRLRATLDAAGPLDAPERMQAEAVIAAFAGSWNKQPFRIDGPARLRYANERVAIDRLTLVAQDSTVGVSGELPIRETGAPGAIVLDARANLATLVRYAPAGTSLTGAGQVAVNGTIRGTLRAIDPELTLVVANGQLATPQLQPGVTNLNVRVQVAGGEANIERVTANWGTATLDASGRVPLEVVPALPVDIPRRGGPATFTARLDGLDVSQVPGAPEGLKGRVGLHADLSATRADLMALEGRITFPELQVALRDLTLAQDQTSTIRLGNGIARVERFTLTGSVGTLATSGTVGLAGNRPIDVSARGNVNVAVLSMFTDAVSAEGETTLDIAARGTVASPEVTGFVDLRGAQFVVDEPTVAAENVNARLVLAGKRISLAALSGTLNGGSLAGSGYVELGAGGIADAAVEVVTTDVAFDAPLDLRSLSNARVQFRRREDEYVIEGQVTLDEGGLTGDINFDQGLLAAVTARRTLDLTEQRNPFLERVRFNLNIDTATPILIDNNLARAEVTADLRLIGTPYEPGLNGRLTILEQSEIRLNERRYEVERGVITFLGERRILPSFDLQLITEARNYDITLGLSGVPGDTDTTLTSSPSLPEPDIMALLVTGRTLDEMRGEEFEIAQEQALSYLAGRLGSQLGRGLRDATGFDTVRVEPQLIASEADPTARLTVGEDIADDLELIYSVDLTDSNDQIWIAEYDVTRRFQTRAIRQSDNSYRADFRHDVRWGGTPEPARVKRDRPIVKEVSVATDGRIAEGELRDMLKAEPGKQYNFFDARDSVTKIEDLLEERGYLQSRVRLQREGDSRAVNVRLAVTAGPHVSLVFEGATPPDDVVDALRTKWRRGVFDTQRLGDTEELLRGWLMDDDYLQPKVRAAIEELSPEERRVRIGIDPGVRFRQVRLAFQGAKGIAPKTLDDIIKEQKLERQLFTDPVQVTELLERYYREQAYLTASIAEPRYEYAGTLARVILDVKEGPRFTIRNLTVAGTAAMSADALVAQLPLQAGDPFLPFAAENALEQIRRAYWRRGYNDVRVDYELALDGAAGRLDLVFDVAEGPQSIVADIVVQGNDKTSERLVREQVELQPGQPLDLGALARSRRNLYDTRAFSIVDIERTEVGTGSRPSGDAGAAADGEASQEAGTERPVRLNVDVREVQPLQLRYGASFDTERGAGGIFEISNHNSLGKARVLGLQTRYDSQLTDARAYITQPSLRYWPIQTIAAIYYRDERNPETTLTRRFDIDRRGASINQERELANRYLWNWGFRYERARSFDPAGDGTLDELLTVTPLTSTLTRETRDEILDATRGAFLSQAFSYSPTWLGADRAYVKYFGQYFHYVPLQRERRERFTNEILRPRFVYAVAVRAGLARALGGPLPISERFFAGGSTTLRGFEQNALGPIGSDGLPEGGSAMFVINNEVRVPLVGIFDGVVFSDIGNVFRSVSDISFADLRQTAGIGLRARTPWFLIRTDYGVLLDRRAGERRSRFYFSLGQAF